MFLLLFLVICCFFCFTRKSVHVEEISEKYYYSPDCDANFSNVIIIIINQNGKKLAGAEFKIARKATDEELQNDAIIKEKMIYRNNKYPVVYIGFFENNSVSKMLSCEMCIQKEGYISICGLPHGTYFLVQTEAPYGYNLSNNPICFSIDKFGSLVVLDNAFSKICMKENNTISVVHTETIQPEVNFSGTSILTATGMIMISAVLILLSNYQKRRNVFYV